MRHRRRARERLCARRRLSPRRDRRPGGLARRAHRDEQRRFRQRHRRRQPAGSQRLRRERPPSVLPGGSFDAEVTVCNQGTQPSYGTDVELRLSTDATVTADDLPAGGGPVPYLDPGQCATVTFPASAYAPDGAYHLGAIVDPHAWISELIETNNATTGGELLVVY
ncbi:CARDB domain-containing protein [Sorangium sp. So ce341]|uniref:CARDB domain-containing protein n=1 Tax=Sorangium sp. So ce341 TaxID=3133302 RepID=UPI003F637FE3